MLWDKKDALQLRSTQIWNALKENLAARKMKFKEIFTPLKQKLPEIIKNKKITLKRYKWITEMIHSREIGSTISSFPPYIDPLVEFYSYAQFSNVNIQVKENFLIVETKSKILFFIFYFLLFNFYFLFFIFYFFIFYFLFFYFIFYLFFLGEIKKGETVVLNDSNNDNVFLLQNYGFMIQKNKITFDLSISLDIDDTLYGNKMMELQKHLQFK